MVVHALEVESQNTVGRKEGHWVAERVAGAGLVDRSEKEHKLLHQDGGLWKAGLEGAVVVESTAVEGPVDMADELVLQVGAVAAV